MKTVNGILLLYHRPIMRRDAATVREHINSFKKSSRFEVYNCNTEFGFPGELRSLKFKAIVLHYSLFGYPYTQYMNEALFEYLAKSTNSYKIAFFQDEHHFCGPRFSFIDQYKIDCVYTLIEPAYFKDAYLKYTRVPKLVYNIPGYVSEEMVNISKRFYLPDEKRKWDIGYRGRKLKFYMGKGSQEKYEIGAGFLQKTKNSGLKLNIEGDEHNRIYGDKWYSFLANCRGCLGVEAGVSIFDLEDEVRTAYENQIKKNPHLTYGQMDARLLSTWEDRIPYRTISPRHFEAAAFKICQILFEGKYSGILQPMVHYIPLKKDFSNIDEVIRIFKDDRMRNKLTENAYTDLIASGRFSYRSFVESFDNELLKAGIRFDSGNDAAIAVNSIIRRTVYWHFVMVVLRDLKKRLMRLVIGPSVLLIRATIRKYKLRPLVSQIRAVIKKYRLNKFPEFIIRKNTIEKN